MPLDAISELATGFEGCEKKLEIDFHVSERVDLREIPRSAIDQILSLAKCTIISKQTNRDFDAYVLSESSLFIYPCKIILKTCGTTLLLKTVSALLSAARAVSAEPDFLQFSRSNFLFPHKQHFPHRAFNEETDYLNDQLGIQGEAYILGSLNGARWHLYIWDFNKVDAKEYKQQTLEIIMFNLDPQTMKTFYKKEEQHQDSNNSSNSSNNDSDSKSENGVGYPTRDGIEATRISGIDELLPGSVIDSHLFTPCGYSCNGCVTVPSTDSIEPTNKIGTQGKDQQAYFTIHITPESQCSFVSFETNAVLPNYTSLVRGVVKTFRPGSFCVSLFVDGKADVCDSRSGLAWEHPGYITKGTTHHAFEGGYNATCSQFESVSRASSSTSSAYGDALLSNEPVDSIKHTVKSPAQAPTTAPLSATMVLHSITDGITPSSYETVASLSIEQMRSLVFEVAKDKFDIQYISTTTTTTTTTDKGKDGDVVTEVVEEKKVNGGTTTINGHHRSHPAVHSGHSLLEDASYIQASAHSILMNHSPDSAFCLIDIGQLIRRFYQWTQTFPRIEPSYVVPPSGLASGVALALSHLGCSFSCQSASSLQSLLGSHIPPSRLLFDLAWKSQQQLKYAHSQHVDLLTAASIQELNNINKLHDNAKILLHLSTEPYNHNNNNNNNNGLSVNSNEVIPLLTHAKKLDLSIVGIKLDFRYMNTNNTTTNNTDSCKQLLDVIPIVKKVFESAASLGYKFTVLDLGSGLPSHSSAYATELLSLLDQSFPISSVRIFADPVAFFDQNTTTMMVNVLAKANGTKPTLTNGESSSSGSKRKADDVVSDDDCFIYYVNDVVKQAIATPSSAEAAANVDKKQRVALSPLSTASTTNSTSSNSSSTNVYDSNLLSVNGSNTTDILLKLRLPELNVGDWLYFPSSIAQTQLGDGSGLDAPPVFYCAS